MRLFAIGDLHLPGGDEKPMNVFGPQWDRHFFRISEAWQETVGENDAVLIPGDISWAMKMEDALPDLQEIGKLPGKKVLTRGNHDYWWNSISRIRANLPEGMIALQQDAADLGEFVVCGTRGWTIPTKDAPLPENEVKIYQRELGRLEMALDAAERIARGRAVIVMLHYPPLYDNERESGFTEILENRNVKTVVYGHLHGAGIRTAFEGEKNGVRYYLTSCDRLDFKPAEIPV